MGSVSQAVLHAGGLLDNEIYLTGLTVGNASFIALADGSVSHAWLDARVITAYVAAASALLLSYQSFKASRQSPSQPASSDRPPVQTFSERVKAHAADHGGWTIFACKLLRFAATSALFALAVFTAFVPSGGRKRDLLWIPLSAASGYAAVLSFAYVLLPAPASRAISYHPTLVVSSIIGVYLYRDVWPLITFTLFPLDSAEGALLWTKLALAVLSGVVLPLIEPYPYIPVDPSDPQEEANLEQTASLLSFALFTFLNPTISEASRVAHLPASRFPPMCDYDRSKNLIHRSFRHLDPFAGAKKNVNLFWGICRTFRRSLTIQSAVTAIEALSKIAAPIGTNRLLSYLETGGEGALVKPWVWLIWLALGPLVRTICFQIYIFYSTGSLVRVESIITSLVFEHALRIRLKAELPDAVPPPAEAALAVAAAPGGDAETAAAAREGEEAVVPVSEGSPTASGSVSEDGKDGHARSETAVSTSTATTVVGVAAPSKGSGKDSDAKKAGEDGKKKKKDEKKDGKGTNLTGRINNLVTSDLSSITSGRDFLFVVLNAPLNLIFSMGFLYAILGWSSFVGMAAMIVLIPAPAWVAKLSRAVQKKKMAATDARVKTITDAMNVLRMIKLFGWERQVEREMDAKRQEELKIVWQRSLLGMSNYVLNFLIPLVHIIFTFMVYTLVMKKELKASVVFSSMIGFNMLKNQLFMVFGFLPMLINANVSLRRVQEFLNETEVLDQYAEETAGTLIVDASAEHQADIGFGQATFAWSRDNTDGSVTPSRQGFRLRVEDTVLFKKNVFNLIIGPTGSGKTSLLMALLGEMHYMPSGPGSWYNLPRDGGVAFAAQESWVQNETIKDNILFGSAFDEDRYKKVIYQCGLERDLGLFEAGDATEIGEKGLTVSGGQKARITLARAVYSPAQILLLDDILAALDVHTSRWIVDKCFKGELLQGRTVILVTHNVAMASPVAQYVVLMGTDGRIATHGAVSDVIAQDKQLAEKIEHEKAAIETDEVEGMVADAPPAPEKAQGGKLTVAEEIAEGHVSWSAFKLYLTSMSGAWPLLFWVSYSLLTIASKLLDTAETWWLGWWAQQYQLYDPSQVSAPFYLSAYAAIAGLGIIVLLGYNVIFMIATLRASRKLHQTLMSSLLTSTFRWLDTTPTSRIIARCTQDIQAIDGNFPGEMGWFIQLSIQLITKLGAVIVYTPVFVFPGVFIFVVGGYLGQIYMRAQLSVKREQSNAKAPVVGVFGSAIAGLTSIRAYGAQEMFRKESTDRIDRYVRSSRVFYNLNRWITIRIDLLSGGFTAALATYLLYGPVSHSPSDVGFSMSMAVGFSGMILMWVRIFNDMEVEGNSLERVQAYINIEHEPKPTEGGTPPAYWPASGDLRVEKLSARYSTDGPKVLQDISFHIKAGERVGVVGRTGSGKSSLTLSLLRCIYTEGSMYYDGVPTHSLNLDALRSNITIIPQVPELMSGTLRKNLDMFDQHDDATLNDALRAAGLFSLQADSEENRITLDSPISAGGSNLSVGQRQILALARAIVRQSKILVLDEATSAIDYETDTIIQSSLRQELKDDVTVITVAHRLQTIMDSDKIMVLDAGRLVEFASPAELLENENSFLRALVDESADKEALYAMVKAKQGV